MVLVLVWFLHWNWELEGTFHIQYRLKGKTKVHLLIFQKPSTEIFFTFVGVEYILCSSKSLHFGILCIFYCAVYLGCCASANRWLKQPERRSFAVSFWYLIRWKCKTVQVCGKVRDVIVIMGLRCVQSSWHTWPWLFIQPPFLFLLPLFFFFFFKQSPLSCKCSRLSYPHLQTQPTKQCRAGTTKTTASFLHKRWLSALWGGRGFAQCVCVCGVKREEGGMGCR